MDEEFVVLNEIFKYCLFSVGLGHTGRHTESNTAPVLCSFLPSQALGVSSKDQKVERTSSSAFDSVKVPFVIPLEVGLRASPQDSRTGGLRRGPGIH